MRRSFESEFEIAGMCNGARFYWSAIYHIKGLGFRFREAFKLVTLDECGRDKVVGCATVYEGIAGQKGNRIVSLKLGNAEVNNQMIFVCSILRMKYSGEA